MATHRPDFIDLRSTSDLSVPRPLRSPRVHVAGEVPPDLSPLDAFALQSQLLARQLKESEKLGRRLSRLPPLTADSPVIVQGRSDYFRSLPNDDVDYEEHPPVLENPGLAMRTEIAFDPANRPVSMHPRMSRIPPTPDSSLPLPLPVGADMLRGRTIVDSRNRDDFDFFGVDARREQSPSSLDASSLRETHTGSGAEVYNAVSLPSPTRARMYTNSPDGIVKKGSVDSLGALAPPRATYPKRSSSIMSSTMESTDGEATGSLSTSFHSQGPRKLSSASSMMSPNLHPFQRSPSVCSEASALPRPSFNFSRPLSRSGTPGLETPARQPSSDSQGSFFLQDDIANTPVSVSSEIFPDSADDSKSGAPSYIYSKFSLPRGKALQRNSVMMLDQSPHAFMNPSALRSHSNSRMFLSSGQAPPSPPSRPSSSASSQRFNDPMSPVDRSKLSHEIFRNDQQPFSDPSRSPADKVRQSEDVPRGRPLTSPFHDSMRMRSAPSTTTSDSASTVKAVRSPNPNAPTMADIPAEEHVTKAIALHEKGALKESTYHLRHAARQNHPTGMLLYALACRHGWGMRPNQREGVEWLRRAAESAQLELADDAASNQRTNPSDFLEQKTRKAQFGLSLYELGISHMNGWGTEQDKALALRCFEIAGSWGDVDALAEAGFCYTQGIGCKKNLKKSAYFYRQAEAKGMSMVGNSWIHKSKYDDDDTASPKAERKTRSKSRARKGLFGKKEK